MKNKKDINLVFNLAAAAWIIFIINALLGGKLNMFGIIPRTLIGLIGVITAPFLHGSLLHIILNTFPFLFLGTLIAMRGKNDFETASIIIMFTGGFAVWLLGRNAVHIGASGIVFGYYGFLISIAWFERSLFSLFSAIITVFLYGGLFFGILPTSSCISWEGHLFGFIAGIFSASILKRKNHN